MEKETVTAIVLAGGSGTRMGGVCKKQYMQLGHKPLLYYSLKTFQESCVDQIVLVTNEPEYCKEEIIQKYGLDKVKSIVPGGKERCHSVYAGLLAASECSYVLIHDGARPFVTESMIDDSLSAVRNCQACIVGMPVKDTIKIVNEEGFAEQTPQREKVWQIQTPQTFSYPLILNAYRKILKERPEGITDDSMAVEYGNFTKVRILQGSYENIKITTPEDMKIAEMFLKKVVDK